MEIIIGKQTDKLGDEYLEQEYIVADIWKNNDELFTDLDCTTMKYKNRV